MLIIIVLLIFQQNVAHDHLSAKLTLNLDKNIRELPAQKITSVKYPTKNYLVSILNDKINNQWYIITTFYNPKTGFSFSDNWRNTELEKCFGETAIDFKIFSARTTNDIIFITKLSNNNFTSQSLHMVSESGRHFYSKSNQLLSAERITLHPTNENCFYALFKKKKSDTEILTIKRGIMHTDCTSVDLKVIYKKKGRKLTIEEDCIFSINPKMGILHLIFNCNDVLYQFKYNLINKLSEETQYPSDVITIRPSLNTTSLDERKELAIIASSNQCAFTTIHNDNTQITSNVDAYITRHAAISANIKLGALIVQGFFNVNMSIVFFDPENMIITKYAILPDTFAGKKIYSSFTGDEKYLLLNYENQMFYIDLS
jgi:hypothetical protein